jgi:hypothetical protein
MGDSTLRTDIHTKPPAASADDAGERVRTPEELAEIADLQALLDSAFDDRVPGYDIMALSRFRNR